MSFVMSFTLYASGRGLGLLASVQEHLEVTDRLYPCRHDELEHA